MFLLRLEKELVSYEKEVVQQSARIQKMKDRQADIYDIRKQVNYIFAMSARSYVSF